jgi:hypothetical protein
VKPGRRFEAKILVLNVPGNTPLPQMALPPSGALTLTKDLKALRRLKAELNNEKSGDPS